MHRTWTIAGPHKEAVARQGYAGVGGRQTRDDRVSGNTDTQGKRGGPSITAFIKAQERGIRFWIQSVTSPTTTIRQFPIFRKRTLYSRGGGPFLSWILDSDYWHETCSLPISLFYWKRTDGRSRQ